MIINFLIILMMYTIFAFADDVKAVAPVILMQKLNIVKNCSGLLIKEKKYGENF
ncbi:MAG: hypothetical protein HQK91_01780 [Nitrospirae bacterium]|nr:hypothetical protein [Nitrospirota bacterium]MBF0540164.1 hypothetical protein [Nitrospirota bacterium]